MICLRTLVIIFVFHRKDLEVSDIRRIFATKMRSFRYMIVTILCSFLVLGCAEKTEKKKPRHYTHEVISRMTPIKNQGKRQICWVLLRFFYRKDLEVSDIRRIFALVIANKTL